MRRYVRFIVAAVATAAIATPAKAAPVECGTFGCATASVVFINYGCTGPVFGYYTCSWEYRGTYSASSVLPGTADATLYYNGGAVGGRCTWTTGGCTGTLTTGRQTQQTTCAGFNAYADLYVIASGPGNVRIAQADDHGSHFFPPC